VRTIDVTTGAGAFVARGTLAAVDGTTVVTANGKQLVAARI
jgi:hypothetical protein